MKHSLFRFIELIEISILYIVCFTLNITLIFVQTINLDAYPILKSFIESILDFKLLIVIFITFIVLIFHYQFIDQKKAEIYCRILVGDTKKNITSNFAFHNFFILIFSFILSLSLNFLLNVHFYINFWLVLIFTIYIIFFTSWVNKK